MPPLPSALRSLLGPFVRYCIIGTGNTVLDFGIYTTLTRGWMFWEAHFLLANAIAFTMVVTWSFFWNKRWTFGDRSPRSHTQYVKFVIITLVGLGLSESALLIGVRMFGVPDLVAKVFAAPLVVLWNFTAYRYWAFRPAGS
jgi:putative flippase GtrA